MIMKIILFIAIILRISLASAMAQESCIDTGNLLKLDAEWEKALLESNVEFLKSILADDFIWVHNHAGLTDTKESLLKSASKPRGGAANTKSRISKDVKVILFGSTGIVTGFTIVDRGPTPTTYHFMRTYAEVAGKCFLVANHTMAIPDDEE